MKKSHSRFLLLLMNLWLSAFFISARGFSAPPLAGNIKIDGSSTVFPISEAVAEEFQKKNPKVRVSVGVSGTGGGFKKFVTGEIDISDASRPIKAEEAAAAKKAGIEFYELQVAYDGLSVLVHPKNKLEEISFVDLKKLWEPASKVKTWQDINATWPKQKISLYGPGPDSGTFDYFTEVIVGTAKSSRSDFTASEDDNVIIRGVSQDENALGYVGYAYYQENKTKLKALKVTKEGASVAATPESIESGKYPLSRPVFIYVSKKAADRKEVAAFVNFYLASAYELVKQVKYVPLKKESYKEELQKFKNNKLGSRYSAH